jgi:putative ABC transport system permease protein
LGEGVLTLLPKVPLLQGYVAADTGPGVLLGIAATALATAVAGAAYPARFASRIHPAEALRYE